MRLDTEELEGGVTKVILDGRMDIAGAEAVDLKMNMLAGSKKFLLLDLRKVSFLGSTGARALFSVAQAVKSRGGKVVMFGPNELVEKVLKVFGMEAFVPIHHDFQNAIAALQ
jgi:anti-sigma B factor antagonist